MGKQTSIDDDNPTVEYKRGTAGVYIPESDGIDYHVIHRARPIRVKDLISLLKICPPDAKVLIPNTQTYEEGLYSVNYVERVAGCEYVCLDSDYKTDYSEVL